MLLRKQNLTESNTNPTHTLTWGIYPYQKLIVQPRGHNFQDDLYLYMETSAAIDDKFTSCSFLRKMASRDQLLQKEYCASMTCNIIT
jgi:hypothetical protein